MGLTPKSIYQTLEKCQAVLSGHFLLSSGLHSDKYFQCAQLFQYPEVSAKLMKALGEKLPSSPQVVIGPALGGIIMAYELARYFKARAMFAEREEATMHLRRNFQLQKGEKVLIAEDVVTTGKSTMEVIDIVLSLGGLVSGIACVVDRRSASTVLPYEVYSLLKIEVQTYKSEDCPLCKQGSKAQKPGSRFITA